MIGWRQPHRIFAHLKNEKFLSNENERHFCFVEQPKLLAFTITSNLLLVVANLSEAFRRNIVRVLTDHLQRVT